MIAFLIRLSHS